MMRRETLRKGMRVKHDSGWVGTVYCPDEGTSLNQVFVVVDPEFRDMPRDVERQPWTTIGDNGLWVDHQDLSPVDEPKP